VQKQLRNYQFPPRVCWLLKESNRSPLDTTFCLFFLLLRFIFLTEREKTVTAAATSVTAAQNRAHRSLENFKQQHANGEKETKKVIWQFLYSRFFFSFWRHIFIGYWGWIRVHCIYGYALFK
jgi:hypothetical protein